MEDAQLIVQFLVRCGTAALCGMVIGLERELKNKPAGFRTNTLICLGAAIYTDVGLLLANGNGSAAGDPARIAAQIVTGIGFLGAGCIIQDRGEVHGLTTAATIWVVAAIGIVAGVGHPVLALILTGGTTLALAALRVLERRYIDPEKNDTAN
jgi:putative Mg2+ transporter-C (MgtC) family protein